MSLYCVYYFYMSYLCLNFGITFLLAGLLPIQYLIYFSNWYIISFSSRSSIFPIISSLFVSSVCIFISIATCVLSGCVLPVVISALCFFIYQSGYFFLSLIIMIYYNTFLISILWFYLFLDVNIYRCKFYGNDFYILWLLF